MSAGSSARGRPGGLLGRLGVRVRALRLERRLTRRELAARSGLSERFLARIESGDGNISLTRFASLAEALGEDPAELLREAEGAGHRRVALLGLRGAGKSTIGRALARKLGVPFVELDSLIEEQAGMSLSQVFEMHGERYYRRLERDALARFLSGQPSGVLATGGGIVTDPRTLDLLRRGCLTVWLSARPEDHWDRVVAQGDRRPMAGNPEAMRELRGLLADREPLYALADIRVDTSALTVPQAVAEIASRVPPDRERPSPARGAARR